MKPVFLPSGDRAIVMQWGDSIDEDTNAHVIAFAEQVRHSVIAGIVEIVPTYRSLLVCYDPVGPAAHLKPVRAGFGACRASMAARSDRTLNNWRP